MQDDRSIVLFDGVCNLCNASVNFVLDHDPAARFRFASLQSTQATTLLSELGVTLPAGDPESLVLVEGGRAFTHSTAALRIARRLSGAWKLLYVFVVVPRPLRDVVYRLVAHYRYRWFGRRETCRVATGDEKARFLDAPP